MSVRKALAGFWVELERATGEVPTSIELPPKSFDALVVEAGGQMRATAAKARLMGRQVVIVLTHDNGQRVRVVRAEES